MGLTRRTQVAIAMFIALMVVLTVATLVLLVVDGNASTLPSATYVPRCLTSQLSVKPGSSEGAAGSIGQVVHFENISRSRCGLLGYPGMLMLDASGRPLATEVHRGSSGTVAARAVRLVVLAAGGEASFDLGYADSTGYGNERCPTSARVEITPPNDFAHLTISWHLQPYGGDIPHLECGEITVSPVFAGR
jgi:hypothetical protein